MKFYIKCTQKLSLSHFTDYMQRNCSANEEESPHYVSSHSTNTSNAIFQDLTNTTYIQVKRLEPYTNYSFYVRSFVTHKEESVYIMSEPSPILNLRTRPGGEEFHVQLSNDHFIQVRIM